jgi:lipopolysaccharide biosynthesis glycosyltransferase
MNADAAQNLNTLTLVVSCDDHYVILLAALIRSVESNLQKGKCVDLWVVADNISVQNRERLLASVDKLVTAVHWVEFSAIISKYKLPGDRSSYPLNIYARLFVAEFIPTATTKVLYLDADMIALTDLWSLWATDLSGYDLAAVQDPRIITFDNAWGGIKNYHALGLTGASKYFNTGLLLINVARWRECRNAERVLAVIRQNIKYANYPDQYGMNVVFAGNWLELESAWNTFVDNIHGHPKLIHFIGRKPIYKSYGYSSHYRDVFYNYLKTTAWHDAQPIHEYSRAIKKIKNIVAKISGRYK